MTKPPPKKILQKDYVKTTLRLPPELHEYLLDAAESNGHSLNAEILERLRNGHSEVVAAELAAMRAMLQLLIDRD